MMYLNILDVEKKALTLKDPIQWIQVSGTIFLPFLFRRLNTNSQDIKERTMLSLFNGKKDRSINTFIFLKVLSVQSALHCFRKGIDRKLLLQVFAQSYTIEYFCKSYISNSKGQKKLQICLNYNKILLTRSSKTNKAEIVGSSLDLFFTSIFLSALAYQQTNERDHRGYLETMTICRMEEVTEPFWLIM